MSVAELQACLARLYVSDTFRALFRRNPEAALAHYELTPQEVASIEDIDQRALEGFAASLQAQRRDWVARAYPASFAWHGLAMQALHRRFLDLKSARPTATLHHEVIDFGHFAEQTLTDRERFPEQTSELIRFERLSYEALFIQRAQPSDGRPKEDKLEMSDVAAVQTGLLVARFHYNPVAVNAALRAGWSVPEPRPDPVTIVFRPEQVDAGQRVVPLTQASATVLALCDGQRTVFDVAREVEALLGPTDLTEEISEILRRLRLQEIVTIMRA